MKKVFYCFILVLLTCVGFAACSRSGSEESLNSTEDMVVEQIMSSEQFEESTVHEEPSEEAGTAETYPIAPLAKLDLNNYHYTLTEVGKFQNIDHLAFSQDVPVIRKTVNGTIEDTLMSYMGEDLMGKGYHDYDYYGNGIAATYTYNEQVVDCQLINLNTGEIYISDVVKIAKVNDRYYTVYYNEYAKVFDLEKRKFLEDILIEQPEQEVVMCGTTMCKKLTYDTYDFYLSDGTVFYNVDGITLDQNIIFRKTNEEYTAYDCNFKELFSIENVNLLLDKSWHSKKYFEVRNREYLAGVVNINGDEVLPAQFSAITAYEDYFIIRDKDFNHALYYADGTQVFPYQYSSIYGEEEYPIIRLSSKDGNKYLYILGGSLIDITGYESSNKLKYYRYVTEGDYSTKEYVILATGETLILKDARDLTGGLVFTKEGKVIELIHGQTLLNGGYDFVATTGEYLYALKDEVWTVYSWEIVKNE